MKQYLIINLLSSVFCLLSSVICRPSSVICFKQNKPNFKDAQMNVSIPLQMTYKNKSNWTLGENKPNSNPILSAVSGLPKG